MNKDLQTVFIVYVKVSEPRFEQGPWGYEPHVLPLHYSDFSWLEWDLYVLKDNSSTSYFIAYAICRGTKVHNIHLFHILIITFPNPFL